MMPNNDNMAVYRYVVVFSTICGTTSARGRHMLIPGQALTLVITSFLYRPGC